MRAVCGLGAIKRSFVDYCIKSLPRLVTFFLGIPYRLTSFLTTYKALLASLSTGVYFYIGVAAGVAGRA